MPVKFTSSPDLVTRFRDLERRIDDLPAPERVP
jgi:hypothetical protein